MSFTVFLFQNGKEMRSKMEQLVMRIQVTSFMYFKITVSTFPQLWVQIPHLYQDGWKVLSMKKNPNIKKTPLKQLLMLQIVLDLILT